MKINKVKIDGKIVNISKPIGKESNKYYFIKIKQSRVFEGEKHSTFFDVKVYSNHLKKYKELFVVNKKVIIEGKLDSYFKDNNLITYIVLENIDDNSYDKSGDIFSYDKDGTMLWHGKRCEKVSLSDMEEQELKDIIREIG